jgi:hypothetical protein
MLRYHFLTFASQQVDSISWHQLIARGYGLVDTKDGLRKREAFQAYTFMVKTFQTAQFLRLDIKREYYILQIWVDEQLIQIHWSLKNTTLKNENYFDAYDKLGKPITREIIKIGSAPVYLFITKAQPQHINCV